MNTSKNYLLASPAIIMVFNCVDRLSMGLLLQDIKTDLSLNDTQLGLLTGIACTFFYGVMAIPIARRRGEVMCFVKKTQQIRGAALKRSTRIGIGILLLTTSALAFARQPAPKRIVKGAFRAIARSQHRSKHR